MSREPDTGTSRRMYLRASDGYDGRALRREGEPSHNRHTYKIPVVELICPVCKARSCNRVNTVAMDHRSKMSRTPKGSKRH